MIAEPYRESIHIEAEPAVVFRYWTDPELVVRWMGDRAELDPREGGVFNLFFGDKCMQGHYVALEPPRRLVIAWGRRGSSELPPSSSTLEIELTPSGAGTRVDIVHHGLPDSERHRHALGWAHYLARMAALGSGHEPDAHVTPPELNEGADG